VTAATIPNHGVTRLTALSTYTLDGPVAGMVKTIYRSAALSTGQIVIVSTSSAGQASFNSLGGTQVMFLNAGTTTAVGPDASVTLLGESSTQWRILSVYPGVAADSTSAGVYVTT
jgi:hypothetical protein